MHAKIKYLLFKVMKIWPNFKFLLQTDKHTHAQLHARKFNSRGIKSSVLFPKV